MQTFADPSKANFSLSPQERRQRQEIMTAVRTVQSALDILSKKQDHVSTDLQSRHIVSTSQQCMAKLQSFVEQAFNTPSVP